MAFDIALIIVFALIGVVLGLIVAGIFFVYKLSSMEKKARKSWKDKKGFFEVKQNEEPIVETKQEGTEEKPSFIPKKKSLFDKIKGIFKRNKELTK